MKVPEAWKNYAEQTVEAGNRTRQLAFAGIAIVWLFRDQNGPGLGLPLSLLLALMLFSVGLLVDAAQPTISATKWWHFARSQEKRLYRHHGGDWSKVNEEELAAPPKMNRWAERMFHARTISIGLAYPPLIWFLIRSSLR